MFNKVICILVIIGSLFFTVNSYAIPTTVKATISEIGQVYPSGDIILVFKLDDNRVFYGKLAYVRAFDTMTGVAAVTSWMLVKHYNTPVYVTVLHDAGGMYTVTVNYSNDNDSNMDMAYLMTKDGAVQLDAYCEMEEYINLPRCTNLIAAMLSAKKDHLGLWDTTIPQVKVNDLKLFN